MDEFAPEAVERYSPNHATRVEALAAEEQQRRRADSGNFDGTLDYDPLAGCDDNGDAELDPATPAGRAALIRHHMLALEDLA